LAAERARSEGYRVEMVIVSDDIAIPENPRPRGVAGTLFVHKIAGHAAELGADLEAVTELARSVARESFSIGASLSSCSIPGQAFSERLAEGEGELGLGIHGEPGIERFAMSSATKLVDTMMERLNAAMPAGGRFGLMINNLGAVPPLEMSLIAREVLTSPLADRIHLLIGPAALMTALDMNGFSLSLVRLDAEREAALRSSVDVPAWPGATTPGTVETRSLASFAAPFSRDCASHDDATHALISAACRALVVAEGELNALDAKVGDGDTGSTLAIGARSILRGLNDYPLADPAGTAAAIGRALATSMGGSSGVLMSIFFTATAAALQHGSSLPKALRAGLDRVMFYGGAAPGDRTMIDALAPALQALDKDGLQPAIEAARAGAEATRHMRKAKAGRSSYLSAQDLDGAADPGAMAVAHVFASLRRISS
jgi:dihydroxyacetone kinase